MRVYENGIYRDLTEEEVEAIRLEEERCIAEEKKRPLTESEVNRMLIAEQINALKVDDNTALRMKEFYPNWESGVAYSDNFKVRYGDRLYKVRQAHTSQSDWTPDKVPSLFIEINETASGTVDDPIPYNGNMVLEKGKHYSQYGVIYLCTDNINATHDLNALVGLYVKLI